MTNVKTRQRLMRPRMAVEFIARLHAAHLFGQPLDGALQSIAEDPESGRMAPMASALHQAVAPGSTLAEALARLPRGLAPVHVRAVAAAEACGKLTEALGLLSTYMAGMDRVRSRLRKASVSLALAGLLALFVCSFIVCRLVAPGVLSVPEPSDLGLDGALVNALGISILWKCTRAFLWCCLVAAGVLVLLVWVLSRTPGGRRFMDRLRLRAPFYGRCYRAASIARFSHTLGLLLGCGVDAAESLEWAREVCGNHVLDAALAEAARAVEGGASLAKALETTPLLPHRFGRTLANGEKLGRAPRVLIELAARYEDDVERHSARARGRMAAATLPLVALAYLFVFLSPGEGLLSSLFAGGGG